MRCLVVVVAILGCSHPRATSSPVGNDAPVERVVPASPEPGKLRVRFEANVSRWQASESAVLAAAVRQLRADPQLTFQISGHTDPAERDADDTGDGGLSQTRAEAVRRYLRDAGIAERRLITRAVGTSEPRGNAADNRRVELDQVTIRVSVGGRVVVTDTDVEILDRVTFVPGTVTLEPKSRRILDAIASTLHGNPSILRVEIQGHTDDRGDEHANLRLSHARAKIVVSYLVAKGIDPKRLEAQGYGGTQPLDRRPTEEAWAKNNRIELLILERAP